MKEWCIPKPDARFVAKMEDVLDVYQQSYNPARPVICVDEKSKELREEIRDPIATRPSQPKRIDSEYRRRGTANIFLWIEPLAGRRGVRVTERRTKQDFAQLLKQLADKHYPDAEKIVLVVDNLNTHGPHSLYERFEPAEARRLAKRFEWHYTPEHGSWLNIAECELSVMARQCTNRRIASRHALAAALQIWERQRNALVVKINWQFTAKDSRIKLRRLYPAFSCSN